MYIHTAKDVLIRINPECRIPRTFKRFSGLMGMLNSIMLELLCQIYTPANGKVYSATFAEAEHRKHDWSRKVVRGDSWTHFKVSA